MEAYEMPAKLVAELLLLHSEIELLKSNEIDKATKDVKSKIKM